MSIDPLCSKHGGFGENRIAVACGPERHYQPDEEQDRSANTHPGGIARPEPHFLIQKLRAAKVDHVPGREHHGLRHRMTVHPGPIATAEIADRVPVPAGFEQGVLARDPRAVHDEIGVGIPTDQQLVITDGSRRAPSILIDLDEPPTLHGGPDPPQGCSPPSSSPSASPTGTSISTTVSCVTGAISAPSILARLPSG